MNVMVTLQKDYALSALVKVFQANSTVLPESLFYTNVAVLDWKFVTAIAYITMEASISATHLADPTLFAMIYTFLNV